MTAIKINEQIIEDINLGKENAFSILYDCYFSYLCAYATTYVFDPDEAKEVVNDVFISIWHNKGHLSFPIHSYLMRGVQNRCLNYIRALHTRERVLDEYREELLAVQEEFCKNDNNPLQLLEVEELKDQVNAVIHSLSAKCRLIFEKYLYEGMSPQEIADEQAISVNTVRVHIKNAMDHIKLQLGSTTGILLLLLIRWRN
ncbi:RNA polymerase sigma-70 factor [uncultured Bacteroides sp.]|uniref:RNA polymerase sigma-70 factor n=1 Tax=uncultured Bacteroides sp. TaxID=162156 RepID=UPI0025E6637F|nr:RNA polymerase sigma-70 factor [uncultured Bacteroides sp.]